MNIYVGNLSPELDEDSIRKAFEAFGEVESANIIKDKFSGQSRGFGFVTMRSQQQAEEAIAGLNETELGGQSIKVSQAHDRPAGRGPSDRRGGGRGGPRGGSRGGGFGGRDNNRSGNERRYQ
jgi:RNA recognition motif-containing protein